MPGQSYAKVARQLERAVAALAPEWAEVKVTLLHGGDPVQVDVDHPAFEVLDEAFEAVTGRRAVRVRSGGSIPIVPELGLAGAPVLLTGIGLPDDGLHSPNEKLDLRSALERDRDLRTVLRAVRGEGRGGARRRQAVRPAEDGAEARGGLAVSSSGVTRLIGPEYRASVRACSSSTPMSARAEAMIPATTSSAQ